MQRLRLLASMGLLLAMASGAQAAGPVQLLPNPTLTTLINLNGVTSGTITTYVSPAYDNTIGQTGNGYVKCDFELIVTFTAVPTVNSAIYVWHTRTIDGTTFTDSRISGVTPGLPLAIIPTTSGQTLTHQTVTVNCPPGKFSIAAEFVGTTAAATGSGNSLKVRPWTYQLP